MKKRYFNIQHNSHKKQFCTKAVLVGILSVLVFFSSCSNAFLDGGSASGVKTGTVTGSIDFGGALPKEILDQLNSSSNNGPQGERTAFPNSLTASSVEVYAQIGSDTDTRVVASADLETKKYLIGNLTYGKEYTITAKFKNDSEKVIMQGSVKVTLSDDEPVVNKNISVAPTQTENGEGSIILYFSVNEDVGWSSNDVVWSYVLDNDNEQPMDNVNFVRNTFNKGPISSGAHSVKFIFKKINTNYILYQFTETINVFDNLTTNRWVKNGNEPYLTSSSCIITKACVDKFAQTTFYVDSTRQTTNSSGAGYTTQSGTYFNPFVKVYSAFNKIMECSSADYTIYVKDGHSEDFEGIEFDKNISIETYKDTPGDGLGQATLEMKSGASTFLWIDSNTKFSLKNFILDGKIVENGGDGGIISNFGNTTLINCELKNGNTCGSGGAIWNTNGASITLENCNIHDCSSASSNDGGGIYNTGIITIKETVISGCPAGDPMNSSYGDGGGIYNNGTLTLTDCTISGNTATFGGGIYNAGTLTFSGNCLIGEAAKNPILNINDYSNKAVVGGGIYTTKPFTVKNGNTLKVYGNVASSDGGGIQINLSEEASITGLDVQNCCAYAIGESSHGGGIYIMRDNAKFTISSSNIKNCKATIGGGVYDCTTNSSTPLNFDKNEITECSATEKGGGLYLSNNSKCNLKDTKISGCSSVEQGGGIFMEYLMELDIQNGSVITDNTSTAGAGIYVFSNYEDSGSKVKFSGSGYVDKTNDLYLDNYAQITIDSPLSLPDEACGVAATITPNSYNTEKQILSGSAIATEYFKFAVKPNESDKMWGINSNGKLIEIIGTKAPGNYAVGDIVFNDGSATPYSEGLTLTEEQKNAAIAVIFRVGDGSEGNKTLGVGIYRTNTILRWCKNDSVNGYSSTADTYCAQSNSDGHLIFSGNTDGSKNLLKLIEYLDIQNDTGVTCNADGTINFASSTQETLKTNYPAFEFAYYYGKNGGHNITPDTSYETGWYLPSISELYDFYMANNINGVINNALTVTTSNLPSSFSSSSYNDRFFLSSSSFDESNLGAIVLDIKSAEIKGVSRSGASLYILAIRAFN